MKLLYQVNMIQKEQQYSFLFKILKIGLDYFK